MSMLKSVWEAIMRLFAGMPKVTIGSAQRVQYHDTDECSSFNTDEANTKAKKQRKQRPKELASMGALLEHLDETFDSLQLPYSNISWVPRERLVGLRKLGVHVVYDDERGMVANRVPANRILPAMMCVSFGFSKQDTDSTVYPAMLFAVKEKSLPAIVDKCQGQHYLFGACYKSGLRSIKDKNKGQIWLAGYITVKSDGSLYLHKELKPRKHTIKISSPATRRAVGGKQITYVTKSWGKASLAEVYDERETNSEDGESMCIVDFAFAMNWWMAREEQWSVAVKKNGERVTFSVPKELTARFFKDRIKVTNKEGVTKKIIHFVHSHERVIAGGKTTVKEHIRGLSEFDWKGYECRVTAPKFNGVLSTEFTVASTVVEDDEEFPPGLIDGSKLGSILADLEDGRMVA